MYFVYYSYYLFISYFLNKIIIYYILIPIFFYCWQEKDNWAPAELTRWEIFNPDISSSTANKTTVPSMVSRKPLKNVAYILNETPYLKNLKLALKLAQNRPCSYYTKCLYLLQIIFIQKFAAAAFLVSIYFLDKYYIF